MMKHTFTFMGTGAGCGVPAFFCDCPACEEARANPNARRGDCGVMVTGSTRTLIDTPPDIRSYFNREGVRYIDDLIFTHWHYDHVGGLGELEYMVQLLTKKALPTFASPYTLESIGREFEYMMYCLARCPIEPFEQFEIDDVRYTALPVTHAPGTYGYLIETDETRLFYASDTGKLPPETAERIRGVDILAMDATYWKENGYPQNHHSVQECIEEGLELDAGKIYLTHMCMHYSEPITLAQLEEYLEQYDGRVTPAADGLSFEI
ncbi:MAG: MBL fold metallo-hydrolase [Eggerthellaceae bacterium]|nr:MBL fold metallo-hydrolase [Eggerthellaceae bacterium]